MQQPAYLSQPVYAVQQPVPFYFFFSPLQFHRFEILSVLSKPSLPPNVSRSHCARLSFSSAPLGCSHRQPRPVNNSLWSWN